MYPIVACATAIAAPLLDDGLGLPSLHLTSSSFYSTWALVHFYSKALGLISL